jgi:hypothetical protein
VDAKGNTAKVCTQRTVAGPVASPDTAEGWWFITCGDRNSPPAVAPGPTTCVYINHQAAASPVNACEANPGETYSAEYMGQIPTGGCPTAGTPSAFCASALGGTAASWECYAPGGGAGTCICTGK